MAGLRLEIWTYPEEREVPCLLCGKFFPQPSVAVVLFDRSEQLGDLCASCLAGGPAQMAERLRERVVRMQSQAEELRQEAARPGTGNGRASELATQLVSRATSLLSLADGIARGGLADLRVLIVESDPKTADSLAGLVRLWGHDAQVVQDGASAVAAACAYQPHVLLFDLDLPLVDASQVRRRADLTEAIFVALTAHPERGQEAGFDYHFIKPVTPDLLEPLLKMVRSTKHLGPEADTVKAADTLKIGPPTENLPAPSAGERRGGKAR